MRESTFPKFAATSFLILSLLFSCEKEAQEEYIQTESQEPALLLKHFSRQEIEKNTELTARLTKFNEKLAEHKAAKNAAKTVYNSEYDFTIYTDAATYVENGDYHSYTFPLVQDADEKMANVLFESNEEEGGYNVYLVRYDYTANEFNNLDLSSLSLATSMEPIDLDLRSLSSRASQAYVCVYSYERHCSEGWINGSGGNLGGGGERCYWVLTAGHCETVLYADQNYTASQNNNTATMGTSGSNTGGARGSHTSPTPSPYDAEELLKINAVKAKLNLSYPERSWVDQHGGIIVQLHDDYLAPHMWSNEARAFAGWVVDFGMLPNKPCGIGHDCVKSIKAMAQGLRKFHGQEGKMMSDYFNSLIADLTSFTKADLQNFYNTAKAITEDYNKRMFDSVSGGFIAGITPILEIALLEVGTPVAIKLLQKIPVSWVYRGTRLNNMVREVAKLGSPGTSSRIRMISGSSLTKSKETFNMLTKNAISVTREDLSGGKYRIIAKMGNNNFITFRNFDYSNTPNLVGNIDLNFPGIWNSIRELKFIN